MTDPVVFLTACQAEDLPAARLMIHSLRRFGGELAGCPVWVFSRDAQACRCLEDERTRVLPLVLPEVLATIPFGEKAAACAQAEQIAGGQVGTLVWIDPACLVVQPPLGFVLEAGAQAAFRPVHIRNVGLPPGEPLDAFWTGIHQAVGVEDTPTTVTSFVDGQLLRTYFNSHAFAINPALGLMGRWSTLLQSLAGDAHFMASACADPRHRTFLFQALLSTLVAASLGADQVRLLPPTYNYPYHLQGQIAPPQRAGRINALVCLTCEEHSLHPQALSGIGVDEPLKSWLVSRMEEPGI